MSSQIWQNDHVIAKALGAEIAAVRFYLSQDPMKPVPKSLDLLISGRVIGAQIGSVNVSLLKDGNISLRLIDTIGGVIDGRIDDLQPLDLNQSPVDVIKDPNWNTPAYVTFVVTGLANITVPIVAGLAVNS